MKKILAIMLGIVFLSGCRVSHTTTNTPMSTDTITIGSILMLTGPGASWGNAAKNGIELAVDDLNARGGILGRRVSAIHEDSTGSATKSLSAFRKLTETDGVHFIIGTTWSSTGLPLITPAKERGDVVMISPSLGKPEFNESSPRLFNTWPHDEILSRHLAEKVYADGYRRVALFGAQEVWVVDQTKAFKETFESLGGTIAFVSEPQVDEKQVGADVLKVRADSSIDAIVYTNTLYDLGILTAKKMREFDITLPSYSLSLDNDIIANAQGAYDDMIFLTFLTPTEAFAKRYESTYGLAVDIGADSAYDAVMMIAKAIEATGSTSPDDVVSYLNKMREYDGASGHLVADGKGGFTKDYVTKIIKDGKVETL